MRIEKLTDLCGFVAIACLFILFDIWLLVDVIWGAAWYYEIPATMFVVAFTTAVLSYFYTEILGSF